MGPNEPSFLISRTTRPIPFPSFGSSFFIQRNSIIPHCNQSAGLGYIKAHTLMHDGNQVFLPAYPDGKPSYIRRELYKEETRFPDLSSYIRL